MIQLKNSSKSLAKAGIISAIYVASTLALYPLSFGAFQVRVSESLTLLPLIFPESVKSNVLCYHACEFNYGIRRS